MSHFIIRSFLLLSVALAPFRAWAIEGLGEESLSRELRLPNEDGDFDYPTDEEVREYFNLARCQCPAEQFQIRYQLVGETVSSLPEEPVLVYLGTSCDSADIPTVNLNCSVQNSLPDISKLYSFRDEVYAVSSLFGPPDTACPENDGKRTVYAMVDEDSNREYENVWTFDINYDQQRPPLPEDISTNSGESAVDIGWSLPSAQQGDIEFFQVLCQRADSSTSDADKLPRNDPRYVMAETLCPSANIDSGLVVEDRSPDVIDSDAGVSNASISDELRGLDAAFVCGEVSGTATGVRVGGLENGVAYNIVVVSVDAAGNASAAFLGAVTPRSAVDFWEYYKGQGGGASGGCSVGTGFSLAGTLLLVLGLGWLVRKRRMSRALATVITIGTLLAASDVAIAQPYWETLDDDDAEPEDAPSLIKWNFGVKFGPYKPAIDDESAFDGMEEGPWQQTFGGAAFLTQFELDRFFLWKLGQLGVNATAGYLSKSAKAFQTDGTGQVLPDQPSAGDPTGFRMIPMSVSAVYRLTELDDRFGVPVVPYGKLGLAYYLWWITAPDGGVAETPTPECPDIASEDCQGDKARGGSFGWQAAFGVAIRAERLDKDAEMGLRNEMGIEHAGIYGELSFAKVDGFGSDTKLNVGDLTWFAGVNFEF